MTDRKTHKYHGLFFPVFALSITLTAGIFAQAEPSATDLQKQIWAGQCPSDCVFEKNQLQMQLLESPIVQVKDISDRGVPYPKKAIFASGMRAMLKVEESYFAIQKSEVLAYRIDQLFQFNLVPTTVLRNVDGKLSSLQLFVEGVENASSRRLNNEHAPQELRLFDYLTRNFDRHSQNWMYFVGGDRPIAVDNDQSFSLYVFDELRAKFPIPPTPIVNEVQYKSLCNIQLKAIQQVVSGVFEGEMALKISAGINRSREDMILLYEKNNAATNSCLVP